MKRAVLLIVFLVLCILIKAKNTLSFTYEITDSLDEIPIINRQYIENNADSFNLDDLIRNEDHFSAVQKKLLNAGSFNTSTWIKIKIKNLSKESDFIFEHVGPYLDTLQAFVIRSDGTINPLPEKGMMFPQNVKREYLVAKPSYLYNIDISTNESISLLLYCSVDKGFITASHTLWTPEGFNIRKDAIRLKTTYLLLCAGFSLLIILIGITFYVFTKDKLQVYYVGFIFSNITNLIVMANFFSAKTVEKYLFFGENYSDSFGLLQVFFGLKYAIHFLNLKELTPQVYKLLQWVIYYTILTAIFTFFFRDYMLILKITFFSIKFLLLFSALFSFGISIYLIAKKSLMARYFFVAYTPLFYFVLHYFLMVFNFTERGRSISWEFVIFFEVLVLTVAMAHRYYLIGKANTDYQLAINKQQKEQISHIIKAQENERSKIAKELHDGIVQEIGSVKMGLNAYMHKSHLSQCKELNQLVDALDRSGNHLRDMSHQMMPRTLSELGIVPASKQVVDALLSHSGISFTFEVFGINSRPTENIEISLYRIVQELLGNIIKHSKATEVSIQLYSISNYLMLVIEDNGIAFDIETAKHGMGLRNIKSRLDLISGTIKYQPNLTKGMLTTVQIPCPNLNQT